MNPKPHRTTPHHTTPQHNTTQHTRHQSSTCGTKENSTIGVTSEHRNTLDKSNHPLLWPGACNCTPTRLPAWGFFYFVAHHQLG